MYKIVESNNDIIRELINVLHINLKIQQSLINTESSIQQPVHTLEQNTSDLEINMSQLNTDISHTNAIIDKPKEKPEEKHEEKPEEKPEEKSNDMVDDNNSELSSTNLPNLTHMINIPSLKNFTTAEISKIESYNKNVILVTSTQYPGLGGSATNAYNIVKFLRKNGYKVAILYFENIDKYDLQLYDPEHIGGVFRCNRWSYYTKKYNKDYCSRDIREVKRVISTYLGRDPHVILCKNYVAPIESHYMYEKVPKVYLISGSKSLTMSKLSYDGLRKSNKESFLETYNFEDEKLANRLSTLIVPNSEISRYVYTYLYHNDESKIIRSIDTSLFTKTDIDTTNVIRCYDIAFIASNYTRTIKGADLAYDIFKDTRLSKYKKLAIGENSDTFNTFDNITTFGLLPNTTIKEMLCKTKVLIIPSVFEASPNIAVEAESCGCKIITTLNVGNSEKHNSFYRVYTRNDSTEWVDKIVKCLSDKSIPDQHISTDLDTINKYRFFESINSSLKLKP